MAREFLTDVDLKAKLLLAGGAGTSGQALLSGGPSAAPSWGSVATDLSYNASTRLLSSSTGTDVTLPVFSTGNDGFVPASGLATPYTSNYLRADGAWAQPPGSTNLTFNAVTSTLFSSTGNNVVIPIFTSLYAGFVPGSGGGTTNFLRADGTWATPPSGATDLSYTASTRLLASSTGTDVTLPLFSSTEAGLVGGSGGGTTNFLRADGTWAAPASGATDLSYTASTRLLASSTGADVTLPLVSSTDAGLAPSSGGGTSNFLRADGTWAVPPGTATGTKTLEFFTTGDYQPPATAYALLTTINSISFLAFDASTEWSANFVGIIPEATVLTNGLTIIIHWRATSGSSGNVRWSVQLERMNTDLDADSFATATEANSAAPGTVGLPAVASITTTNLDGLTAGDPFRLKIARKAADATNDTMTGDANVFAIEVRAV